MDLLHSNYINGTFYASGNTFASYNPATEEELGQFPISTSSDVCSAVRAAKESQKSWKQLSRIQRGEYINKLCSLVENFKDFIARVISLETGKTLNESNAEVVEAIHMLQYTFGRCRMPVGEIISSEIPGKDVYVIRKPKGVVAVISPWNFPFAIGGFWTSAPALLEGNTVVFKPSEETPLTGQLIAQLYHVAGFPKGVFNLIHGDGNVGEMLVVHPDVNHICFTGSYEVGRAIQTICASQGKKTCSCEMGSKSAVIVCADADIEMSVQAAFASAFKLSGQRCVSAGRVLVESSIFMDFAARFVNKARFIQVDGPFPENPEVFMGPLINSTQRNRVEYYNEAATADPATQVLLPGYRIGAKGYFLTPHVYTTKWNVGNETREFLKNEVFGPHVALIPFDDLDEAIAIYNDTDFGLSVSVCTNDFRKMRKVREACEFGLGYVNLPCIGAESHAPFGGVKKSGYGGSSAAATFDAVVHKVSWTVNNAEEIQMAQGLKV